MASATPEQDAAAAAIDNAAAASASASTPDGDTSDEPQQQQQRQNNQRPSFEDFWRRSKAARRAGNVTFLPSVGVVGENTNAEDDTSSGTGIGASADASADVNDAAAPSAGVTKAQARRAQVRRAQIQHRQRKANYTKELEMDIARLRELIEQTEAASRGLRTENAVLRRDLSRRAVAAGHMNLGRPRLLAPPRPVEQRLDELSLSHENAGKVGPGDSHDGARDAAAPVDGGDLAPPPPPAIPGDDGSAVGETAADATPPGTGTGPAETNRPAQAAKTAAACTVHMDMSELTMTPVYRVSGTPSPGSSSSSSGARSVGDFSSADSSSGAGPRAASTVSTSTASPKVTMSGMSTGTIGPNPAGGLTQEQTELVINFILALENICWNHFECAYFNHRAYDPSAPDHGHALMASSLALQQAGPEIFTQITTIDTTLQANGPLACRRIPQGAVEWRATGLTLDRLYGLAAALNPPDRYELAPVQAWFELVTAWGPDVALDATVLEELLRGLRGAVRCLNFGAVIQRPVFDAAVERAVGARFPELVAAHRELMQQQQQQSAWGLGMGMDTSTDMDIGVDVGMESGLADDCGCERR